MGVLEAHLVSGQPTEIGARGVERMKLGPLVFDVGIRVSTSVPDRRIGWRMSGGSPFTGEVILDLEPLDPERTRAVWSGSIGLTSERAGRPCGDIANHVTSRLLTSEPLQGLLTA